MADALPPDLSTLFVLVARALATENQTLEQLCAQYGFSEEDYRTQIEPNPFYQKVYADYVKEWQSLGSTHKRIAFAAQVALEDKLPVLADRMGSRSSELADAVATAKLFRELAGIAPPAPGAGAPAGERFHININIGETAVKVEAKPVLEIENAPAEGEKVLGIPSARSKDSTV